MQRRLKRETALRAPRLRACRDASAGVIRSGQNHDDHGVVEEVGQRARANSHRDGHGCAPSAAVDVSMDGRSPRTEVTPAASSAAPRAQSASFKSLFAVIMKTMARSSAALTWSEIQGNG